MWNHRFSEWLHSFKQSHRKGWKVIAFFHRLSMSIWGSEDATGKPIRSAFGWVCEPPPNDRKTWRKGRSKLLLQLMFMIGIKLWHLASLERSSCGKVRIRDHGYWLQTISHFSHGCFTGHVRCIGCILCIWGWTPRCCGHRFHSECGERREAGSDPLEAWEVGQELWISLQVHWGFEPVGGSLDRPCEPCVKKHGEISRWLGDRWKAKLQEIHVTGTSDENAK